MNTQTIQRLRVNLNTLTEMYLEGHIPADEFSKQAKEEYDRTINELMEEDLCLSGMESVLRARTLASDVTKAIWKNMFPKEGYEIL